MVPLSRSRTISSALSSGGKIIRITTSMPGTMKFLLSSVGLYQTASSIWTGHGRGVARAVAGQILPQELLVVERADRLHVAGPDLAAGRERAVDGHARPRWARRR